MKSKSCLTLADAKIVAATCEAEALRNNWTVVIAIVDDGGHLMWLQRLDGAPLISIKIATGKARTAAMGRRPSKSFTDRISDGELGLLSLSGELTLLEGGEPIMIDGSCVGAVGISGVKPAEDAQIARTGISEFLAQLQR
jgi:uncharacterized protein GlcG (DUF336 family)